MKTASGLRKLRTAIPFVLACAAFNAGAAANAPFLRTIAHAQLPADLQARMVQTLADDRAGNAAGKVDPVAHSLGTIGAGPLGVSDWLPTEVSASDGATSDQFGWAVAFEGDTALIGAPNAAVDASDPDTLYGAVYVFTRTDGVWTEGQKFFGNGGSFGSAIALSGTTALIGANSEDGFRGAAYIFTATDGVWSQTQKLLPDDSTQHDQFGWSLAMQGNTAMISSYSPTVGDNINQGAVYVFTQGDDGSWSQSQKLIADDGVAYDLFGSPLTFDDDAAVIGSGYVPINGDNTRGSAYVFNRSGGVWSQTQKLLPSDGTAYDSFGIAVAQTATQIFVGANGAPGVGSPPPAAGAVYVYSLANGNWSQTQKLTATDAPGTGFFGQALAVEGDTLLVGASGAVGANDGQGAVYRFQGNSGAWSQAAKWVADDGGALDNFGWSIALHAGTALVGSYNHQGPAIFSGAAYFYTAPPGAPVAAVTPAALNFALQAGSTGSNTLTIANTGTGDLDWAIAEAASGAKAKVNLHAASAAGTSVRLNTISRRRVKGPRATAPWAPRTVDGGLAFVLDDGTYEDAVSLNNQTTEAAGVWLNRFTPAAGTGAFTIDSISIEWPDNTGGSLVGKQINLVAYYDADGDGDPGNAVRLGGDNLVTIDSLDSFIDYTVNFSVPGAGDIYVGFENSYALGGTTPILAPAAIDENVSQARSWVAAMQNGDPDVDNLGNNDLFDIVDNLGIGGNWLIRASATTGAGGDCSNPSDVPWLSESPATGSVSGGATQDVTLSADASSLQPGSYSALLCVTTNDPAHALVQVPVSLTVSVGDAIFADGFDGAP